MNPPRIGFVTCVHPIYNLPSVIKHRDSALAGLRECGCEVEAPDIARDSRDVAGIVAALKQNDIDLLVLFFCTWVAEEIPLGIARDLRDVPLLLWALPYLDRTIPMPSPMTGLTATGCNIRRMGKSFAHTIGEANADQIHQVARSARVAAVVRNLRKARFGIIGSQCPGMIDTGCDEALLQECLGVTTIRGDIDRLLHEARESSPEEATELATSLVARVGASDVPVSKVADQYRLMLGMKSIVATSRLDGFAVRCWPELRDQHKTTICLTLSEMTEAGVPTACEADLTALVTSYILTEIAGQPSYSLEVTGYLESEQALQLAHCGSAPLSMAVDPSAATVRGHMRTGAGALIEFGFKPGTITIAKLLRPAGDGLTMFIGRGDVVPTEADVRGSVATVRVEPSPARFVDAMLREAVEHHLVVVYGDWTADLLQFCEFAKIKVIRP